MPTQIFLMRHAETSQPSVFHGYESDIDLGPRGFRQAELIAPLVASYRPSGLVSSGMLRARQTAEAISQATGLPIRVEKDLYERKVGKMQGTPVCGEFGVWPETLKRWVDGETSYTPEGMESFDDIQRRVMPVWERIAHDFQGKSVVIVAHGIVCRVLLLSVLEGYNVADWSRLGRIGNVSISKVVGDGKKWVAERIGYLPEEVQKLNETEELPTRR
jgi:probable phosphoglycerate mutase